MGDQDHTITSPDGCDGGGWVRVWLPGVAYATVTDGNWPSDNRSGWADLQAGLQWRARGRGRQFLARLRRGDALDLADYLDSVAGAVAGMRSSERDGGSEHRGAARAAQVLRAAADD